MRTLVGLILAGAAYGASGIGMATGSAAFFVNGASVTGNATIFFPAQWDPKLGIHVT